MRHYYSPPFRPMKQFVSARSEQSNPYYYNGRVNMAIQRVLKTAEGVMGEGELLTFAEGEA